jgi:hypothetical protein
MNDSPYTFFEKLEIAENIFSEDEDSTPNDDSERGFQNSVFGLNMNKNNDEYYWKIQQRWRR